MNVKKFVLLWIAVVIFLTAVSVTCFWLATMPLGIDYSKWQNPGDCVCDLTAIKSLGYECRLVDTAGVEEGQEIHGAYVLRRRESVLSWEILCDPMTTSARFSSVPGHLFVSHTPDGAEVQADPSFLQVGRILLRGHPDELRRVLEALR